MPGWAAALSRAGDRVLAPGGRGGVPLRVVIDAHKAATGPFVLALMLAYGSFTTAAWVYLALHGSYGVAWLIKDLAFPDRRWARRTTVAGALAAVAFLSLYWVAPFLLVAGQAGAVALGDWSPAGTGGLAAAVALHTVGLALMMGADAQKHVALRAGGGLITGGLFRRVRHPNYLGEMMIYGSYALVVGHWLPWLILAAVWGLFFLPNILVMESSLSRYPDYPRWRRRAGLLWPRV